MSTTPAQRALSAAGLPNVQVGGGAFSLIVPSARGRQTGDEDLAITLPRGEDPRPRFALAVKALTPLGLREERLYRLERSPYWFMTFFGNGKVDLFVNGIADWDFREGGSGCVYYPDDERGSAISASGLLICKLVAQRPGGQDLVDAATLLLQGGVTPSGVAAKATRNLAGRAAPRRLDNALAEIIRVLSHPQYIPPRQWLTDPKVRARVVVKAGAMRAGLAGVTQRPYA